MFPKPGDLERAVNSRVQELKTQGSLRGVDYTVGGEDDIELEWLATHLPDDAEFSIHDQGGLPYVNVRPPTGEPKIDVGGAFVLGMPMSNVARSKAQYEHLHPEGSPKYGFTENILEGPTGGINIGKTWYKIELDGTWVPMNGERR